MEITSAAFVISLADYGAYPGRGLPEIAIAGRSNVGKSSLINSLCRRKGLAKTSGTPGKTRLINVFNINQAFHLIDLPGYGYARVDKGEKRVWGQRMGRFFDESPYLRAVIQLVDIRHEPSQDDLQMIAFLRAHQIPMILVATKADKISRAQRQKQLMPISRLTEVQPYNIIPYSSETGEGRPALLNALEPFTAPL